MNEPFWNKIEIGNIQFAFYTDRHVNLDFLGSLLILLVKKVFQFFAFQHIFSIKEYLLNNARNANVAEKHGIVLQSINDILARKIINELFFCFLLLPHIL